jgi:hypothetical protein
VANQRRFVCRQNIAMTLSATNFPKVGKLSESAVNNLSRHSERNEESIFLFANKLQRWMLRFAQNDRLIDGLHLKGGVHLENQFSW